MFEPLYTAEEMRAAEAGHDVAVLMDRAGKAVADLVLRDFDELRAITVVCGGGNNGRPCRGGGCKRGHLHPLITLQFEQNCTGNRLLPDLSNRGFGWCRWLQGSLWFIGTFVVVRRPVRPSAVKKRIGPMPAASRCVMERCSAKVDQPTPAGGNGKPSPVLHGDRGLLHPRNPHSVLS